MSNVTYVVVAYALTWVVMLAYALTLRAAARRVAERDS